MKRWLLLSLVVLLALPSLSYVAMPFIAKNVVESWLLDQGFQKPVFSVEYPSHRELLITQISVEKHTDNRVSTLTAGPIRITYEPWALFLRGELSRIEIPSASLDIAMTGKNSVEEPEEEPSSLDLSLLLPDSWLDFAPADELVIGQLDVKWHGPNQPLYRFTGNIFLTQERLLSRVLSSINEKELTHSDIMLLKDNRFKINVIDRATPIFNPVLRLTGQLSSDDDTITLQTLHSLDLEKTQKLARLLALPEIEKIPAISGSYSGKTDFSFAKRYEGNLEQWLSNLTTTQDNRLNMWASTPFVGANGTLNTAEDISLKSLYLNLSSAIGYSYPNKLKLSLAPESELSIVQFKRNELAITKANLTLNTAFNIQENGTTTIEPFSITITPHAIRNADMHIASQPIKLVFKDIDFTQKIASINIKAGLINLKQGKQKLPGLIVSGNIYTHLPDIKVGLSVQSKEIALNTAISMSADLDKELIDAQWRIKEISLAGSKAQWQPYLPFMLPEALTFTSGNYTQTGHFQWFSGRLDGTISHIANNISLTHENISVEGVSINSKTHLRGERIDEQGSLKIDKIDAGILISNLKSEFRLNKLGTLNAIADIRHLSGSLLEGTFQLAPFYSVLSPLTINTDLYLRSLSLDALLQLEQQPGLSGEGILDGDLPLRYNTVGLSVSEGKLHARGPGIIRYQPDASIQALRESYLGLGIALDALSNFHYNKLSILADYSPDGALLLKTQLGGNNPEWNNGQQVNFSMNIEENLHKLMKTLQFTDELTNRIEKRYRTP
ncbi:YdbH domain-containing protein [Neptunomonas japonica]|uniref:YdbH domain-containing protein n=1 Tax=Neptunomonas japonica TaxID=417574 RepID=UPI0004047960|nr:YdbH domain-containing protein [Neptunomonas japonica]